jgi:DNA-binding PadR family transcriptional regulator
MNVSKLVVLGALDALGQGSGYDIDRYLHARMIHRWTDIKRASIYHALKTLAASGSVAETEVIQQGAYPEKTLYAVTDAGRAQFDRMQREAALGLFPKFYGFKLALKLNQRLDAAGVEALAAAAVARIDETLAGMDAYLNGLPEGADRNLDARFIAHDQALFLAERRWILETTDWYVRHRMKRRRRGSGA